MLSFIAFIVSLFFDYNLNLNRVYLICSNSMFNIKQMHSKHEI